MYHPIANFDTYVHLRKLHGERDGVDDDGRPTSLQKAIDTHAAYAIAVGVGDMTISPPTASPPTTQWTLDVDHPVWKRVFAAHGTNFMKINRRLVAAAMKRTGATDDDVVRQLTSMERCGDACVEDAAWLDGVMLKYKKK